MKCDNCVWKSRIPEKWNIDEPWCKKLEEFLDWLDDEIKLSCTYYEVKEDT